MFNFGTIQSVDSPCPEIDITVTCPEDAAISADAVAIIDTGAMISCLPLKKINLLEKNVKKKHKLADDAKPILSEEVKVSGAAGSSTLRKYYLDLRVQQCEYKRFELLGIDREYAIIGRDILSELKVLMDFPNRQWGAKNDAKKK